MAQYLGGVLKNKDFTTKEYVDNTYLPLTGGTLTGDLNINSGCTLKLQSIKPVLDNGHYDASLSFESSGEMILGNMNSSIKFPNPSLIEINSGGGIKISGYSITLASATLGINSNPTISGDLTVNGRVLPSSVSAGKVDATATTNGYFMKDAYGTARTALGYNPSNGAWAICTGGVTNSSNVVLPATTITVGTSKTSKVTFRGIYENTGSGTSVVVSSGGVLMRSSSSKRYKHDINYDVDKIHYHDILMSLKSAEYVYNSNPGILELGMIAEDVSEVAPIATFYGSVPDYNDDGTVISETPTNTPENYKDRTIIQMLVMEAQEKDKVIEKMNKKIEDLEKRLEEILKNE